MAERLQTQAAQPSSDGQVMPLPQEAGRPTFAAGSGPEPTSRRQRTDTPSPPHDSPPAAPSTPAGGGSQPSPPSTLSEAHAGSIPANSLQALLKSAASSQHIDAKLGQAAAVAALSQLGRPHSRSSPAPAVPPASSSSSHRRNTPYICQVDNCGRNLMKEKEYYRRYRVCKSHASAPEVLLSGIPKRYCQQCSVFHPLADFDGDKRSCRKRLSWHNNKRRKRLASENEAAVAAQQPLQVASAPRITRQSLAATAPPAAAAAGNAGADAAQPASAAAPDAGQAGPRLPARDSVAVPQGTRTTKRQRREVFVSSIVTSSAPNIQSSLQPGTPPSPQPGTAWLASLSSLRRASWPDAPQGAAAAPPAYGLHAASAQLPPSLSGSAAAAATASLLAAAKQHDARAGGGLDAMAELQLRVAAAGFNPDILLAAATQQNQLRGAGALSWPPGASQIGTAHLQAQLQLAAQIQASNAAALQQQQQQQQQQEPQQNRMQDPRAATSLINVVRAALENKGTASSASAADGAAGGADEPRSAFQPYRPKAVRPQPLNPLLAAYAANLQPLPEGSQGSDWKSHVLQRFYNGPGLP